MGVCASKSAVQQTVGASEVVTKDTDGSGATDVEEIKLAEKIAIKDDGEVGTFDYRLRFLNGSGSDISPWHDIPLGTLEEGLLNMVVEIPKMSKQKMEVNTKEANNPISQDVKKGKLRDYHGPIFWNYGMFPQTWEDPTNQHPELQVRGDNDPLDAVEIGSRTLAMGSVEQVKVLGVLAMIDDGELDWKVICIHKDDPLAPELSNITDVEAKCPGVVSGIREWLRWYKTPDEKPLNAFGYQERALDRAQALEVVAETHEAWKKLCTGSMDQGKLWVPSAQLAADSQLLGA
mmetsp:Transcript_52621/g.152994  ORF Transcript_52621/g.152994 Transcript_52621/m.152994 type:complete len:290 (+) Transcript_52621:60-929(+)